MCEFGEIKFDTMTVRTELAEAYFAENNNTFTSSPKSITNTGLKEFDGYNVILTSKEAIDIHPVESVSSKRESYGIHIRLISLVKLIKQNADLFSQIEYMVRKIPVEEVKDNDITLIVNHLLSRNYLSAHEVEYPSGGVLMHAGSPLANIACIAPLLIHYEKAHIYSTKETAAVSYLFMELCQEVELEVNLIIISQPDLETLRNSADANLYDITAVPGLMKGCVAAITEQSDLDSAVDELLGTTTRYPWKLSKVLVQESIYNNFVKAMESRANCESTKYSYVEIDALKLLSSNVFVHESKIFLVDYAGDLDKITDKVLVESFRTIKELISLITKHGSEYVSLWANDISEANEIAYGVPSSIVWVNDYGKFNGPPDSSLAIYKQISPSYYTSTLVDENWRKKHMVWSKRTCEERRKILMEAALNHYSDITDDLLFESLTVLEGEEFVQVVEGGMCVGLTKPCNIYRIPKNNIPMSVRLLTAGCAVVIEDSKFKGFSDNMDSKIPIYPLIETESNHTRKYEVKYRGAASQTKVVWTNFGTIFAN